MAGEAVARGHVIGDIVCCISPLPPFARYQGTPVAPPDRVKLQQCRVSQNHLLSNTTK